MTPDADAPLYAQGSRGRGFGGDAAGYDAARPSYPDAVATDLGAKEGVRVLDVGCGTGKSTRLFAALGCAVVGLEPDERMAARARAAGFAVEIGGFIDFDAKGREFDLVVAGQAWHWLDPVGAAAKAATLLSVGGRLAPFWNFRHLEPAARAAIEACYHEHAPEILDGRIARGIADAGEQAIAGHVAAIAANGSFAPPVFRRYPFATTLDADGYVALLSTGSELRLLGDERRSVLLDAVRDAVEDRGEITLDYETLVVDATRR